MYFLIHWEGYRPKENSWEPEENLVKAKESIATYQSRGWGPGGGGHNVRNQLTTTRWQVTPWVTPVQTTLLIAFHKLHYINMIKLFGHRNGPWKAPSYQVDQTYWNTMEEAWEGLGMNFPKLSEVDKEISTLRQALMREAPAGTLPSDNDHQPIMRPSRHFIMPTHMTKNSPFFHQMCPGIWCHHSACQPLIAKESHSYEISFRTIT